MNACVIRTLKVNLTFIGIQYIFQNFGHQTLDRSDGFAVRHSEAIVTYNL